MDLKEKAFKYAVKNALEHDGKAELKAVIGKLVALDKSLTKNLGKHIKEINEVVERVNSFSLKELKKEAKKFEGTYELKKPVQRTGLKELDWAEKGEKVVTRFAPNPNGPFHLGNARAALMSYKYAEKYNGRFILRFDDTDPKVKKPIENAEQVFKEDLEWLGVKRIDETVFASDRMETYYEFMRKVIELGKAYVCICKSNEWRELVKQKKPCPCRKTSVKRNLELFKEMLSHSLKEGKAVLRLKTDLKAKDPSLRDWWIARIVDKPMHPRVGERFHLWPSYNFQSAIDDHLLGVTLIIRGQEHAQNMEKQLYLYEYLNWRYPHAIHIGRVNLEGIVLSTSKIKEGIEKGIYIGWDDPRLGTIKALKRRGFDARALNEIIEEIGVKTSDTTISMKTLIALNKKFIDSEAERFTFIEDPMRLSIQYCKEMVIEKPVHPDFPEKGTRKYKVREGIEHFIVSRKQLKDIKEGNVIRLRHALNARIIDKLELEANAEFTGVSKINKPIISWVLNEAEAAVIMPDATKKIGVIDREALEKKPGDIVQLEQFGYARIDEVKKERVRLYFSHE
jgi:glutamyl-tRNA synthetase